MRPQESPARPVIAPEEWLSQEYPPASAFNPVILGAGVCVYLFTGVLVGVLPGAGLLAGGASSREKTGPILARADDAAVDAAAAGAGVKPSEEGSPGAGKEGSEILASAGGGREAEQGGGPGGRQRRQENQEEKEEEKEEGETEEGQGIRMAFR